MSSVFSLPSAGNVALFLRLELFNKATYQGKHCLNYQANARDCQRVRRGCQNGSCSWVWELKKMNEATFPSSKFWAIIKTLLRSWEDFLIFESSDIFPVSCRFFFFLWLFRNFLWFFEKKSKSEIIWQKIVSHSFHVRSVFLNRAINFFTFDDSFI